VYGFGFDEELPGGYQDADLEMMEFEAEANRIARAQARAGKLDYTCPTCKTPNALTPREASKRYQCASCTRRDEGVGI
jgi:transposase-like protein